MSNSLLSASIGRILILKKRSGHLTNVKLFISQHLTYCCCVTAALRKRLVRSVSKHAYQARHSIHLWKEENSTSQMPTRMSKPLEHCLLKSIRSQQLVGDGWIATPSLDLHSKQGGVRSQRHSVEQLQGYPRRGRDAVDPPEGQQQPRRGRVH